MRLLAIPGKQVENRWYHGLYAKHTDCITIPIAKGIAITKSWEVLRPMMYVARWPAYSSTGLQHNMTENTNSTMREDKNNQIGMIHLVSWQG